MYGPPGNGKTISMKAVMKECDARGYTPLYVKSFQSWMGEEGSMAAVFDKARQMAPCLLILEDLDSLINDRNRSFFLNEVCSHIISRHSIPIDCVRGSWMVGRIYPPVVSIIDIPSAIRFRGQ